MEEALEDAVVARTTLVQILQARKACVKPLEQMSLIMARRPQLTRCELRGRSSQNTLDLCMAKT